MTPIVPPTTVLVPTVTAGQSAVGPPAPVQPVAGTILSSGMAVTQLQAGAVLRGTVTGRNESGQLIVETPRGRLLVATPGNLAPGTEVVVQVRSGGQQPQVMLQPLASDGQTAARSGAPPPPAQSQLTGFATTAVVVGSGTPNAAAPLAQAGAAATPPGPVLETGSTVALRINAVVPPGEEPPPLPAAAAQGPLLRGIITVLTTSGHPIVQTQAGLLLLGTKMAAPVGTSVIMELAPGWSDEVAQPATATARASLPGALPGAPQPFPAIAQALAALRQAGQPVPEAVARHLPHVGKALAQGMIAAASPARGENFGALEMLLRPLLEQAGRSDLADALRQELGRLVASHQQAEEGEWRLTIIPLVDDGELHQLRLYERNQGGGGRRQSGQHAGTRFVVEVEMSQLGPIQLDGLVQPGRLDMMLRSKLPLPPAMRRDIAAIYEEARALTGFTGELGFQQTAVFPVDPSIAAAHAGIVV